MLRVVKLGGSLHHAPELAGWLKVLSRASERVVLVPGGGPFANTVRTVQTLSGISDAAAHHMALLAMEQYGLMLCDMEPGLVPVSSMENIASTLAQGHTPVWLPAAMCLSASDIHENWTVTSDSLAAWLAIRLAADSLTLIKYERPSDEDPIAMAKTGWVDKAFPFFANKYGGPIHVLGLQEANKMGQWLSQ